MILPHHLRNLAHVGARLTLEVAEPVTMRRVLDALEARYPMLRGTIREYETGQAAGVSALLCLRGGLVARVAGRVAAAAVPRGKNRC